MHRRGVMVAIAAVLSWTAMGRAAPGRAEVLGSFPLLLRIEAYVETKPEGVRSLERWVAAVGAEQIVLHLTRLRVLNADVAWWNVLSALEPLPVTFTVYAEPPTLALLTAAPRGEKVVITGSLIRGRGPVTFLLAEVQPLQDSARQPAGPP